jgi:hypothetical protein
MQNKKKFVGVVVVIITVVCGLAYFLYDRKMKVAEGGFTPEETLSLYIQAIEKQDYRLASSYFIEEKQSEEFMNFLGANRYTLLEYVQLIKKSHQGTYGEDGSLYSIRYELPGPDFFARFRKYPDNHWKIIEI